MFNSVFRQIGIENLLAIFYLHKQSQTDYEMGKGIANNHLVNPALH